MLSRGQSKKIKKVTTLARSNDLLQRRITDHDNQFEFNLVKSNYPLQASIISICFQKTGQVNRQQRLHNKAGLISKHSNSMKTTWQFFTSQQNILILTIFQFLQTFWPTDASFLKSQRGDNTSGIQLMANYAKFHRISYNFLFYE